MFDFIGLTGTVNHQLDEKSRVRIPSKFLPKEAQAKEDKSGLKFYFMAGSQGCISVYTKEALAGRLEKMRGNENNTLEVVEAKRKILASIEEVETDKQGRIVITANLRAVAKLIKDLVSIGVDDHFEIWAKEEYEKHDSNMSYDRAYSIVGFF